MGDSLHSEKGNLQILEARFPYLYLVLSLSRFFHKKA